MERSSLMYSSFLPRFTLNSGGCAMKTWPDSISFGIWRKKKVSSSVRMCDPSTSASVMKMILW